MKILALIVSLFCFYPLMAQQKVKLKSWAGGQCSKDMDATAIRTRISSVNKNGNELQLSIAFSDNCCTKFKPGVKYSGDTLYISTYVRDKNEPGHVTVCGCDCCFSLDLTISGLKDTAAVTLFDNQRIYFSTEQYKTYPGKYEIVKGDTINRTNRYGRSAGLWITFHPDSSHATETMYPAENIPKGLADEPGFTWRKSWNEKGMLVSYLRGDTSEYWYENGNLKMRKIERVENGDKVEELVSYYENGQLKERSIARWLAEEHLVYDSCNGTHPVSSDIHEEYYETGAPKWISANDTVRQWYLDGQLQYIAYNDSAIHYYRSGKVELRDYDWHIPHTEFYPCLDNSLRVMYHENGQLKSVSLVRDEPNGKTSVSGGVRYEWSWDENGTLLKSPDNWKGEVPLKPFR